jgi:hypothetical protein
MCDETRNTKTIDMAMNEEVIILKMNESMLLRLNDIVQRAVKDSENLLDNTIAAKLKEIAEN